MSTKLLGLVLSVPDLLFSAKKTAPLCKDLIKVVEAEKLFETFYSYDYTEAFYFLIQRIQRCSNSFIKSSLISHNETDIQYRKSSKPLKNIKCKSDPLFVTAYLLQSFVK